MCNQITSLNIFAHKIKTIIELQSSRARLSFVSLLCGTLHMAVYSRFLSQVLWKSPLKEVPCLDASALNIQWSILGKVQGERLQQPLIHTRNTEDYMNS